MLKPPSTITIEVPQSAMTVPAASFQDIFIQSQDSKINFGQFALCENDAENKDTNQLTFLMRNELSFQPAQWQGVCPDQYEPEPKRTYYH